MAPFKSIADAEGIASSTHHNPLLHTIKEEDMDETATTRHEPLNIEKEDDFMTALAAAGAAPAASGSAAPEATPEDKEIDVSLRLHRKVAEIAAKAYRRASEQSNVLSRAKLADIALVRFDEMEIGKFLGKGSFSNVHEITKVTAYGNGSDDKGPWDGVDKAERPTVQTNNTSKYQHQSSVEIANPRKLLTMHHQRTESGTYRYAVKFLKEEIRSSPQKYAIGTADLVVEGMFLASLAHPNIIKVRGLPEGGVNSLTDGSRSNGYFLILDRLFDTLSMKMYGEWKEGHAMRAKKKYGLFKNKKEEVARNGDLAVRLKVAFDISAALKFLHSKNIIYRDLKPENLGFDVRGDIKLFDLGLVKELHPNMRDKHGNYRLSMAGTPRYMSPECGMYQPYNLSADVYSFSMLLWEILTLEKPLKDFTYTRLKNEIFIDGERPKIGKVFNKRMRALVASGWSQNPILRPSIDMVYESLKSEYLKLAPSNTTERSISHNRRRSTYVAQRITNAMSVRHLMRLNSHGDVDQ